MLCVFFFGGGCIQRIACPRDDSLMSYTWFTLQCVMNYLWAAAAGQTIIDLIQHDQLSDLMVMVMHKGQFLVLLLLLLFLLFYLCVCVLLFPLAGLNKSVAVTMIYFTFIFSCVHFICVCKSVCTLLWVTSFIMTHRNIPGIV